MRTLTAILILALCACGGSPEGTDGDGDNNDGTDSASTTTFGVDQQTPGLFRDTYRLLVAIGDENDDVAIERLYTDVTYKLENAVTLEDLPTHERDTVEGLLLLTLDSMQATAHHPDVARRVGEAILERVLWLDPARDAWNNAHPEAAVDVVEAGAALIAEATELALLEAVNAPVDSDGNPLLGGLTSEVAAQCAAPSMRTAVWTPGTGTERWVEEYCYSDQYREGYCESGQWVEGQCWDVWVEDCDSGGYYENYGYYQYVCYSTYDCSYTWVDRWVWVEGDCDDGYYEEECDSDYYEEGLCYADELVPGFCVPGHYEYDYPDGSWSFREVDASCDPVLAAQATVAQTSARILTGALVSDITDDAWRAAAIELVTTSDTPSNGAYVDAVRQILAATKATTD